MQKGHARIFDDLRNELSALTPDEACVSGHDPDAPSLSYKNTRYQAEIHVRKSCWGVTHK